MPISQDQVTKEVDLNLPSGLSSSVAKDIKEEVGDFIKVSILDYVGDGKSPVTGRPFKALNKGYAEEEKGGRRLANLDLNGDMLNALESKVTSDGVEVGIFDSGQSPKAFNHNQGDTLPRRQFIPEPKQKFVGDIERGINEIVKRRIAEVATDQFTPRERPRTGPSDFSSASEIAARDVSVSSSPVTNTSKSAFDVFLSGGSLSAFVKSILDG
jgi:hypothetical protein